MRETFVFELAILLATAFAGGLLVRRLGYPMALGELLIGIVIGPFAFGFVRQTEMVSMFAELGAIILLFYIGLETEMDMLKKYFLPSIMVAISGAILPLILGYYGGILIGFSWQESLFLGTVLTATSLGITVRMLTAMKKLHTPFGMVILGAGIIDDVIAVVMLTIVLDILAGQLDFGSIGMILFEVVAFFSVVLVVGTRVLTKVLDSTRITIENLLIILLSLCFLVAYLASELGLSTIIGAFAIGVSLSGLKRILTVLQKGKSLYIFFCKCINYRSTSIHIYLVQFECINIIQYILYKTESKKRVCLLFCKTPTSDIKNLIRIQLTHRCTMCTFNIIRINTELGTR